MDSGKLAKFTYMCVYIYICTYLYIAYIDAQVLHAKSHTSDIRHTLNGSLIHVNSIQT